MYNCIQIHRLFIHMFLLRSIVIVFRYCRGDLRGHNRIKHFRYSIFNSDTKMIHYIKLDFIHFVNANIVFTKH